MTPKVLAPWDTELRLRLADRREQLGLSQRDMARKTGWPQSRMSDLERGMVVNPSLTTYATWAKALAVDVIFLISAGDVSFRLVCHDTVT